jgi:N-acetylglucosamine-6-phosphate deacetylase
MINVAGISLIEAVRMMSLTPARIMKIQQRKGSIALGKDADILIFDEDIQIQSVIVDGKILHNKI